MPYTTSHPCNIHGENYMLNFCYVQALSKQLRATWTRKHRSRMLRPSNSHPRRRPKRPDRLRNLRTRETRPSAWHLRSWIPPRKPQYLVHQAFQPWAGQEVQATHRKPAKRRSRQGRAAPRRKTTSTHASRPCRPPSRKRTSSAGPAVGPETKRKHPPRASNPKGKVHALFTMKIACIILHALFTMKIAYT